ncbi:hypothetical protein JW916_16460 [Candidatus Sumerlaeota bacterium]|nr:hypothetical protein [Candidatus Sumerlaeota bacterium]
MQEQLLALWRRIEPRLRPVVFFVFLAMLIAEIVLWQNDAASGGPSDPPRRPEVKVEDFASSDIEALKSLVDSSPPPIEETDFRWLIVTDMFDVRAVESAVAQERQANDLFARAQELTRQQKFREALESCKRALEIRPDNTRARQLKERLEKQIEQDQKRYDRIF